jgi:hypothetical protein
MTRLEKILASLGIQDMSETTRDTSREDSE